MHARQTCGSVTAVPHSRPAQPRAAIRWLGRTMPMVLPGELPGKWQVEGRFSLPSSAPGATRGKWSDHAQGVASPAPKGGPLSGAERGPENGTTGWLWNGDGSLLKPNAGNRCTQSSIRGSESTANRCRERKALNCRSLACPCSCRREVERPGRAGTRYMRLTERGRSSG